LNFYYTNPDRTREYLLGESSINEKGPVEVGDDCVIANLTKLPKTPAKGLLSLGGSAFTRRLKQYQEYVDDEHG